MEITTELLQSLSTAQSFERGENLYDDLCVDYLTRKGSQFMGKVEGARLYSVQVDLAGERFSATCTCPYSGEFAGLCKHIIAVGISIIEGEYDEEVELQSLEIPNRENFEASFVQTPVETRLKFLEHLLKMDPALRGQFMAFSARTGESAVDIAQVSLEVQQSLEKFQPDAVIEMAWELDYGYSDDLLPYDELDEALLQLMEPWPDRTVELVRHGRLDDGTRVLLGMFEGTTNLPEPEDNYNAFDEDGFTAYAAGVISHVAEKLAAVIGQSVLAPEAITATIDLIGKRYTSYYQQFDLQPLFVALARNKADAKHLYRMLKSKGWTGLEMAEVLFHIASMTENRSLWIEVAENFFRSDSNICQLLLEAHRESDQWESFCRVAKTALENWPLNHCAYLAKHLSPEISLPLFLQALQYNVKYHQDFGQYLMLKQHLDKKELKAFVDGLARKVTPVFYVKLLEEEGRSKDILKFASSRVKWENSWKLLVPVLDHFPEKCFELLEQKCYDLFEGQPRQRPVYRQIASCLKVMCDILGKERDTELIIEAFYHHKPHLPALKDELRKAELVIGPRRKLPDSSQGKTAF